MDKDNNLIWIEKSRKIIKDFRIFKACEVVSAAPDGRENTFTQLDSPDWVNIVCVVKNKDGEDSFLMVRQFRHGSSAITMEFPAGLIDKGEEPEKAAKRELLEETGYSAEKFIPIGVVNPNPAFMNNTSYTFFAVNPVKSDGQSLDADELIDVKMVPIKEFEDKMGSGEFMNAITIIAYLWYKKMAKRT
ncbi:MAG: NUDIX hydrolase [Spirochaetaceae bacterium]|nr:NUDIX hydrolase [Spirochaetaceae bacterium]